MKNITHVFCVYWVDAYSIVDDQCSREGMHTPLIIKATWRLEVPVSGTYLTTWHRTYMQLAKEFD